MCDLQLGSTMVALEKLGDDGRVVVERKPLPVLFPWDALNLLDKQGRLENFISHGRNASERVALYWEKSSHLDFAQDLDLSCPGLTVPLSFHVDGVKIYRNQKMFVYSFSSAVCKGPTLDSKIVFAVVREAEAVKPDTLDDLAYFIGYCLEFLAEGIYPTRDEFGNSFPAGTMEASRAGKPFTGRKWRAVFASFRADWEAKAQVHRYIRHYSARNICEHCFAATDGPLAYGDFSPDAPWRDTYMTHDQFVSLNPPDRQTAWLTIPGWRKERNCEDLLHLVHQGIAVPLRCIV